MPRIEPIPMDQLAEEPRRIIDEGVADGTYATPVPLQIFAYKTAQIMMTNAARRHGEAEPPRGTDRRAHPDPQRPTGRVPALHAVPQARLDHRRGRGLPDRPGAFGADRAGATGRRVPRSAVGRPPRHRRRGLPGAGRGLHGGPDRRTGVHLCQHHGLHRFIHTLDVFGPIPR